MAKPRTSKTLEILPEATPHVTRTAPRPSREGLPGIPAILDTLWRHTSGERNYYEIPTRTGSFTGRQISIPLLTLDKCHVCRSTDGLRVCNSCASVIYCSKECQRKDWKSHKIWCASTLQVNLKIFYPAIAYMIEYMRNITPHDHNLYPLPHPALCHKILRSPAVSVRRGSPTDQPIHHTVTLGGPHEVRKANTLGNWWRNGVRQHGIAGCLKLLQHCSRELRIPELLVATCLSLLAEIYSTYIALDEDPNSASYRVRPCFRLEHGTSPIADFGIAKGRIKPKSNRLQTWTYYDPKTNTRTMVCDPQRHYWIYFKTVSGQELTLDCSSFSFGMEACVDASEIVDKLPPPLCVPGCSRIPAYLRSATDLAEKYPYDLIEEKRFPVMQNYTLHNAIATDVYPENLPKDSNEVKIIREFTERVTEKPCTETDMEIILWWRSHGSAILRLVLSGRRWLDWGKPRLHSKNLYDNIEKNRAELLKGAKDPKVYVTGFSSEEE